ncbi:2-amino-4-hydroxy-6-hydroxymethyldihydropteridine diphosphokinase [Goodfellowiella coeruleoviolacea]|uniref:2-amino-4-hydroxy-6-hydroxymethyldihydropteridine diphosphokinase n=1 Tax=Goodfellowiella coeruleoviolacea TaxID=334858 RepID=A0AAE3KF86_9PSEU|nr:2-amino-4-hydroxy-6-hydroxymethyldihydropteridine diphosphokinase [Goodfellowiella coeruleoviolacea]MCP2164675.1 2-amino-4-hydroxy-6-hydroxymethyldihydropteridine diphosphokinase [Goodfellowiella coeruleoviolacea]
MSSAVLSIGSNLGDRLAHLRAAVANLGGAVVAVSPVYQTAPWGPVAQDDYFNAVVLVDDPAVDARGWLDRAWDCERSAGRVRDVRWGPRTLDVDVVAVDQVIQETPDLVLPHPRAHERAFVLVPWLDVAPAAELPGRGPVADLVRALPADELAGVRRRADLRLEVE